jgi:hypothetical protein
VTVREVLMALGGWMSISIVTALYLGRVMRLGAVLQLGGSEIVDDLHAPPIGLPTIDLRTSSM